MPKPNEARLYRCLLFGYIRKKPAIYHSRLFAKFVSEIERFDETSAKTSWSRNGSSMTHLGIDLGALLTSASLSTQEELDPLLIEFDVHYWDSLLSVSSS